MEAYQNNRFYAAMVIGLLALLVAGFYGVIDYYFYTDVGSYPMPTDELTFRPPRNQTVVVPASAALDGLVPEIGADEALYNPFNPTKPLHRQDPGSLGFPPPPPLASPYPAPLPFTGREE